MSKQTMEALRERLRSDETLRARMAAAEDSAAKQALARDAGFDLTEEEANELDALSDTELEALAGGIARQTRRLAVDGESKDDSHEKWIEVLE